MRHLFGITMRMRTRPYYVSWFCVIRQVAAGSPKRRTTIEPPNHRITPKDRTTAIITVLVSLI